MKAHISETLTYYVYPSEHWSKLKSNISMERLLREARRRTQVLGSFPDGESVLMLVAARLRYVSSTNWSLRKDINTQLSEVMENKTASAA